MDKKQIYGLIDEIIAEVMGKEGLEESEARVFVGVALKRNRKAFLDTVCVPTLAVVGAPTPQTTEEAA